MDTYLINQKNLTSFKRATFHPTISSLFLQNNLRRDHPKDGCELPLGKLLDSLNISHRFFTFMTDP